MKASFRKQRPSATYQRFLPSGQSYNPTAKLSPANIDFLKSYLNGSHDNNFQKSAGAPMGAGLDSIVRHTYLEADIAADANGKISILVSGVPEAPLVYYNSSTSTVTVQPWANMPWGASSPYISQASDNFKIHGYEAYRCTGLAIRVDDVTAQIAKQGSVITARLPRSCDLTPVADGTSLATASLPLKIRALETLPTGPNDITAISNNVYSGSSQDGVYAVLPSIDPLMPFIWRDGPDNKAVYSLGTSLTNVNSVNSVANVLGVKVAGSGNILLPLMSGAIPGVNLTSAGLIPVHPSNMMTQSILGYGLAPSSATTPTNWHVRMCASWEFILGVGATEQDLIRAPLEPNMSVMLAAAACVRALPGGYPASANLWNEIWDKFKDVYSNYVSPIATKVISALPPGYSDIANGAKGIMDMLTDTKAAANQATSAAKSASAAVAKSSGTTPPSRPSGNRK